MNKRLIFPFIIFSLVAAIWAGWIRIGWRLPVSNVAAQHGSLMVNSFLASLIFLERAVSFRNRWILFIPFLNALSAVAFAFNLTAAGQMCLIIGSIGFTGIILYFIFRFREAYYFVFLTGAFCLLAGNIILYKTNFYPGVVVWWMGFLLFTIVGERLELSRFLPLSDFKKMLLWICLSAVLLSVIWPFHMKGTIFLAVAFALTATWLLRYDMAKHSIRLKGQHRYSGLLLITGYFWLLITSGFLIFENRLAFGYDAVLHSFFIGFVFSMIFSHAPIILPAVAKLHIKIYRPFLYVWFILLQVTLAVRVIADCVEDVTCRKLAGLSNGVVILLFFISVASISKNELNNKPNYHI